LFPVEVPPLLNLSITNRISRNQEKRLKKALFQVQNGRKKGNKDILFRLRERWGINNFVL
jgi:hypothetical protein